MISSFQPSNQNTKLHLPGRCRRSFATTQQHERPDRRRSCIKNSARVITSHVLYIFHDIECSVDKILFTGISTITVTAVLHFNLWWAIIKDVWERERGSKRERWLKKNVIYRIWFDLNKTNHLKRFLQLLDIFSWNIFLSSLHFPLFSKSFFFLESCSKMMQLV